MVQYATITAVAKTRSLKQRTEVCSLAAILSKAGCFVGIIFLGWFLRRVGFFKEGDFQVLAKIVLRITLPASIVYSFAGKEITVSMLFLCAIGLGLGILYIAIG